MTITHSTNFFPNFPISKQLFFVPGASIEGGFTMGGARISTPDVGGSGVLQIQPAMQVNEWQYPDVSWLMSKTNAEIFHVRLARTPQVCQPMSGRNGVPWNGDILWSNEQMWSGDIHATYLTSALEGTTSLQIDMTDLGQILKRGHVIGHKYDCYIIGAVEYDSSNIATLTVSPPLRRNVTAGDDVFFRPWFTGQINPSQDFRTTYDSDKRGAISLGMITLNEVII